MSTVTCDQINMSLLNKSVSFFKKNPSDLKLWTVVYIELCECPMLQFCGNLRNFLQSSVAAHSPRATRDKRMIQGLMCSALSNGQMVLGGPVALWKCLLKRQRSREVMLQLRCLQAYRNWERKNHNEAQSTIQFKCTSLLWYNSTDSNDWLVKYVFTWLLETTVLYPQWRFVLTWLVGSWPWRRPLSWRPARSSASLSSLPVS